MNRSANGCTRDTMQQFRRHLRRGIAYLATPYAIRSLPDLIRLALLSGDGAAADTSPAGA